MVRWTRISIACSFAMSLANACGGTSRADAHTATVGGPDGGEPEGSVSPADAGRDSTTSPHDGGPSRGETGLPGYAACPNVFADPLPAGVPSTAGRNDSGKLGLRALRDMVEKSRDAFRKYEAAHGGNYWYQRQYNYVFGGFCETTVVVKGGKVESRTQKDGSGAVIVDHGSDSGPARCGHPAVTMEALYDQCLTQVLCKDPRDNYLYVSVDARGLLSQCGYFPINCADDCYEGIETLILTVDGKDWTHVAPNCCPISPAPACCMSYGGSQATQPCGEACDGMPDPTDPAWGIYLTVDGCPIWGEPTDKKNCCGCPQDAGHD